MMCGWMGVFFIHHAEHLMRFSYVGKNVSSSETVREVGNGQNPFLPNCILSPLLSWAFTLLWERLPARDKTLDLKEEPREFQL